MFLHHTDIVTEPFGDLKDANACAGEQTGKGVPHDVGRDPRAALGGHVVGKGAVEIPPVEAAASRELPRGEDVAWGGFLYFHPPAKLAGERHGALLAVFEGDAGVLAEVEQTGAEIEPLAVGLDDLGFAQTGVEAAVEDEAQIVAGALGDEAVSEIGGAEIFARGGLWRADAVRALSGGEGLGGIPRGEAGLEAAPVEEASEEHDIPVCGGGAGGGAAGIVPLAEASRGDLLGSEASHVARPAFEDGELAIDRGGRPFAGVSCPGGVSCHGVLDHLAIGQDARIQNLVAPDESLSEIRGLEGDMGADAMNLACEPIDVAALVDAANFHSAGLSHFDVTLANPIWADMKGEGLWGWCAVEGSNLWPLPCQDRDSRSDVTLLEAHL